jgi:hypothetical protein
VSYSNCNCITFNKETRSALKESARTAIAEGSYSERLKTDKNGDVYIRSFLINDKVNDRGWSIEPNQNILSILGKPLIRYERKKLQAMELFKETHLQKLDLCPMLQPLIAP